MARKREHACAVVVNRQLETPEKKGKDCRTSVWQRMSEEPVRHLNSGKLDCRVCQHARQIGLLLRHLNIV